MDDFKIIARLLAAIRASEGNPVFNPALVDERVLNTAESKRDILAVKLQKAGYIEGLFVVDDVDNQAVPHVIWERSKPCVTISGLEWMESSAPLKKAIQEVKGTAVELAAKVVSNTLMGM